ncbi:hypothetical protein [Acidocella sp.]|jgi:hypothetical protein|uniref:hypothetical protein n=1 Tax=Acidocella sp. TaxID=50710 RepID=UPI002F3EFAEC
MTPTTAKYRAELADLLEKQPASMALSVSWNDHRVSMDRIYHDLRLLHQMVDRKIYRQRYSRSADRSSFWAIIELLDRHPHAHLGWYLPPHGPAILADLLDNKGRWKQIAPAGSHDLQPWYDGCWAAYAAKAVINSTENLIFSDDFINHK